jgi:WD40 repeat protein
MYTPVAAQQTTIPYSHNDEVKFLKLSPDGTHAITADNRVAILWDTRTGISKAKYKGLFMSVSSSIDFDPSGKYCFMGSIGTQSLDLYETATATRLKTMSFPYLVAAFFAKDGETIITVDADSIKVTSWRDGKTIKAFAHGITTVLYKTFLLNDKGTLVYMSQTGILRRFNLETGKVVNFYNAPADNGKNDITGFSSSPSGNKEAVSFSYGETVVFDNASREEVAILNFDVSHHITVGPSGIADTIYNPNDNWFTSNAHFFMGEDTLVTLVNEQIALWDLKENKKVAQLAFEKWIDKKFIPVERDKIWLLGRDSAYLLHLPALQVTEKIAYPQTAELSNVVGALYDHFTFQVPSSGQPLVLALPEKTKTPLAFTLSPNTTAVKLAPGVKSLRAYFFLPNTEKGVLFTAYDTYAQGWDIESGTLVFKDSLPGAEKSFMPRVGIEATPSNNFLLVHYKVSNDVLKVFDIKGLALHDTLAGFGEYDVSKNDQLAYTINEGDHYALYLLNLETKERKLLDAKIDKPNYLKISPSGKYVVHITWDLLVRVYDTKTLKLLSKAKFQSYREAVAGVHFTANEEAFFVEGFEATQVPLYATRTGKRLKILSSPDNNSKGHGMVKYLIFDTGYKGVYAEFSGQLFYFDLQTKTTRRLSTKMNKPFKYEKDGSFWVKNEKAMTLQRYLPKPGGVLTLVEKKMYPKGFSPFTMGGGALFSTDGTGVTVRTVDASGKPHYHYTFYSVSASEIIIK